MVKFRNAFSSERFVHAGCPQGTKSALLMFLVLINAVGFVDQKNNVGEMVTSKRKVNIKNEIHLKFVDDFSVAETIKLNEDLVKVPVSQRILPDNFHARTGHILPLDNSSVYSVLVNTQKYAEDHKMKINFRKTNLMIFNPCSSIDFLPEFSIEGNDLAVVEKMRLLGLIITPNLKWVSNTQNVVLKANKRMWILRRLKKLGAPDSNLLDVYVKQIRCILEYAVPVWQGSITVAEKQDLERIQKIACHIILGERYQSYKDALQTLKLETLEARRYKLCLNFALKLEKSEKFRKWFKPNTKTHGTRSRPTKYVPVKANHDRFRRSPISLLTNLLNAYYA